NGSPDDVPDEFVGAMVRDVIMHEIGHVLGLRHNFKASTLYTSEQIRSQEWRDEGRPISASVMDYNAIEYDAGDGPSFMTTLGPYDKWVIRYGYAADSELEAILGEATKPEHAYLTDEDLYGPDPTARSRDLGRDALEQVEREMGFVQRLRGMIGERVLEEGKTYQRARDAYLTLLATQSRNLATAVRYVGGVYFRRGLVGSAEGPPTVVVPAAEQRRALGQIVQYGFRDEAFGLTPELLDLMSYDRWMDTSLVPQNLPDPQLDVHDLILGVQASHMTSLLSPPRQRAAAGRGRGRADARGALRHRPRRRLERARRRRRRKLEPPRAVHLEPATKPAARAPGANDRPRPHRRPHRGGAKAGRHARGARASTARRADRHRAGAVRRLARRLQRGAPRGRPPSHQAGAQRDARVRVTARSGRQLHRPATASCVIGGGHASSRILPSRGSQPERGGRARLSF
ncbi:MAG: zinc-dependent metalloprotease, partial [Planctomycetota bacterium]